MTEKIKNIPIRNALLSVYHKEGLEPIVEQLVKAGVQLYATGGTLAYLKDLGAKPVSVEEYTGYPPILGGRVKTLHPKIFGGILARKDHPEDLADLQRLQAHFFDLIIVDLYPFSQTAASGASQEDIIEKLILEAYRSSGLPPKITKTLWLFRTDISTEFFWIC